MYICKNQYRSKDETDREFDRCCNLSLGNGAIFLCPYELNEIILNELRKYSLKPVSSEKLTCKLFEISSEAEEHFISLLKKKK